MNLADLSGIPSCFDCLSEFWRLYRFRRISSFPRVGNFFNSAVITFDVLNFNLSELESLRTE